MILYLKDFIEQQAIIDYDTTNTSFIKFALILKEMGIRNSKFVLALFNPRLKGVDPFNPDLTDDEKLMIAHECRINPWYYVREVVRITQQGTINGVPFQLDRANAALLWVFMNSVDVYETIPRQIGKTIAAMVLTSWLLYFAGKNTNLGLFARGASLQVENVKRLKDIRDSLPNYLISKDANGLDANNKEGITYTALNNQYKTYTAQSEMQSALDQGRGQSLAFTHWDEFAYYKMNWLSYPAAIATTDAAAEQLRLSGVPTCNVITTTAGRLDEKRGMYAFKIKSECLQFTEQLYDLADRKALIELVETSNAHMIYIEFSYKQLGKDDAWFRHRTRSKDPDTIKMDYLNWWISGTSQGIVPTELLEQINASKIEPKYITFIDSMRFLWYVDEETFKSSKFRNTPFIIACDTSDNVNRDYTTILILDPTDMSVAGTAMSNIANLVKVAKSIVKLLRDFPRSIFIPERNKNGAMFIDVVLTELENTPFRPLHRIYNTVVQKFHDGCEPVDRFDIRGEGRKAFGFNTTETSRDQLTKQVLFNTLTINYSKVYDQELISEINGLREKNGRIDHGNDVEDHDDLLIAYLIACWLILYGKNLTYYGIDADEILSRMDRRGNKIDPEVKIEQTNLQTRIRNLEDKLSTCSSEIQKKHYENELASLRPLVDDTIIDPNTIAVTQIKQEKEKLNTIDIYDLERNEKLWMGIF